MTESTKPKTNQSAIPAEEQRYLETVLAFIDDQLAQLGADNDKRTDQDRAMKEEAWESHLETKDGAGVADSAVMQQELALNASVMAEQSTQIARLAHQRNRPYFGRIDLAFAGDSSGAAEPFYIGIRELLDADWMRQYVIDWRSPLATLYYEAETGPVTYQSPGGPVNAEMTRRRQIQIHDAALTFVLDTDQDVQDTLLQWVLQNQHGAQMREIVSTLQKEQNAIVRHDPRSTVIVQGVAGSGKTSVALHRAAYLLYKDPTLRSSEILIITPNPQFSEYIADVLPDLGEARAPLLSIGQLTRTEIHDAAPHLSRRAYPQASAERHLAAASLALPAALDRAFDVIAEELFVAAPIVTPYFRVEGDFLAQLYRDNYGALAPFARFDAMIDHLAETYADQRFGRVRGDVEQALRGMYRTWSLETLTQDLLAALPSDPATSVLRQSPAIPDDVDCALIAWAKQHFFGRKDGAAVRHVILDEMQDLYPFQHQLMSRMFPCPRTIIGDVHQAVRFPLPEHYLDGIEAFYQASPVQRPLPLTRFVLNHAYRSTLPITEFARAILGNADIEPFHREGAPVVVNRFTTEESLARAHAETLERWHAEGYTRTAIIVADPEQVAGVAAALPAGLTPAPEIVDLPSTKGMEFEAVIIWDASALNYGAPLDRTRLYVAATRALHALSVGYVGAPSPWLP